MPRGIRVFSATGWYASTGLVVLGLERLCTATAFDRGQLQHRVGHLDPPAAAIRAGQGVAGSVRPSAQASQASQTLRSGMPDGTGLEQEQGAQDDEGVDRRMEAGKVT